MFKLSKHQIKELSDQEEIIANAWAKLEDETNEANERIRNIIEDLERQREEYQTAIRDGAAMLETIADEAEGEYDDKSERWQEGERGEQVREWIDTIRGRFDEITDPEEIEFSEIEMPDDFSNLLNPDEIIEP